MNWDAIGAAAELLGAIGVIVSLLYLATQIRQNTASIRASTFQDFTSESAETTRTALTNREILDEIRPILLGERAFDPLRDLRFHVICGLYARNLQAGFLELRRGRIDPRQFESYASYHIESWVARPGWAQWWAQNRKHYDSEYVAWLESLLADHRAAADEPA
jgi:hypothetical protein